MRRQAAVAVVEPHDPVALGGEELAEPGVPVDQLGGETHHQQQRRIRSSEPNVSYSSSIPDGSVARGIRRVCHVPAPDSHPATVPTMTTTRFGVHVGLQHTTPDELLPLYGHIEALGFDWISVWDHFYGATGQPDDADCLEAVAMHAALACATSRVRCGSLVYSIGYRHPAVLAKAITTIDHLSGGRAEMGLGAGWAQVEYAAYGIPFPTAGVRLDQMEEGVQVLRGLLHDEVTTFEGTYFRVTEARNEPRPVQPKLPIWIGGQGEKRTLRIAARYADGWNAPFVAPEQFAAKRDVLHRHCADVGRDPSEIRCAVNVGSGVDRGVAARSVRRAGRLRASGCAVGIGRRGRRTRRPVRRSGRRPGQPGAAGTVRRRRPRAVRRRCRHD